MAVLDEVRRLVDQCVDAYRDERAVESRLLELRQRLDEPLRVAIAGKVKAGKSTLLNALVGEVLAPTDAGECTRLVTWYRDSHTSQVLVESSVDGSVRQVPVVRSAGGALDVDVDDASAVRRLIVEWPSDRLRRMTLIDTPGTESLSASVSERTTSFLLAGDDGASSEADAVVYLMKHFHASDARFLETFSGSSRTPVKAVAVLSRADEVGAGRADAMASASAIAARYRADPRVAALCQTVVPVAGLVAQASATLTEAEVAVLRALAVDLSAAEVDALLASADRFGAGSPERAALLLRLGVFGVRLGVSLLRSSPSLTASGLASALAAASGLDELRSVLSSRFGERADVLKAASGLAVVEDVLEGAPVVPSTPALLGELERISASAHELAEVRLVTALRSGGAGLGLPAADVERAVRVASGGGARARLGLGPDATDEDVRSAAAAELAHWRGRAENPVLDAAAVEACSVLARTCEGILSRLG